MFSFTYRHRVRYRECDPMGVVYHGHYLDYLEYARTEALRNAGLPYRQLEESGIIMPVVDISIRYLSPARYDEHVLAKERVRHVGDEVAAFDAFKKAFELNPRDQSSGRNAVRTNPGFRVPEGFFDSDG